MKTNNKSNALSKYVTQITSTIAKAESTFPVEGEALTTLDKKHSVKPRKGADNIVRAIAELAKAHGLDSSALHSDGMLESLDTAAALAPLVAVLEKMTKRVADAQYSATSSAWANALQFYALLQRRAQSDGQLAASLDPISTFFAYRHQSVLESKPTKLQTRMTARLRSAERLVARSKPRASVLEQEYEAHATPAPAPVAQPAPQPVVQAQPQPVVAKPVVQPTVTIVAPAPAPTNGVTNGVNGYANGASNGALNGAASTQ